MKKKPTDHEILTALNKIIKESQKPKKVELSNVKELESLIKKARNVEGEMVDKYLDAKKFAKDSIKSAKLHLKNLNEISSILKTKLKI